MKVVNIDIHKLNAEEIDNLIERYTQTGWIYNQSWNLSTHQWVSFTWPNEEEPPEM